MQWKHKGSPTPRKFRVQKSAGKIMATVFWDGEGLLLLEFMPDECTITGDSYATTVKNLHDAIEEKRRGSCQGGSFFSMTTRPSTNHGKFRQQ